MALTNEQVMIACLGLLTNPVWDYLNWCRKNTEFTSIEALDLDRRTRDCVSPELKRQLCEYPVETLTKWDGERLKRLRLQLDLLEFYRDTALHQRGEYEDLEWVNHVLREERGLDDLAEEELEPFLDEMGKELESREDTDVLHASIDLLKSRQEVPEMMDELGDLVTAADLRDEALQAIRLKAERVMRRLSPQDVEAEQVRAWVRSLGLDAPAPGLP